MKSSRLNLTAEQARHLLNAGKPLGQTGNVLVISGFAEPSNEPSYAGDGRLINALLPASLDWRTIQAARDGKLVKSVQERFDAAAGVFFIELHFGESELKKIAANDKAGTVTLK